MKIILILFIALSSQLASAQNSEISWSKGTWHGSGHQPNALGQKDWLIDLTYVQSTDVYLISYPTFPCNGIW